MSKLFVISDLHLGGRPKDMVRPDGTTVPAFQFNNSYPALIEFIDWVAGQARARRSGETELVLNGDIVDFLADDDYDSGPVKPWTANEHDAADKLGMIAARTRGAGERGVFEALGGFVDSGGVLTLLLGNHDVELSMPLVRRRLLALLGASSQRIQFIYDGEAYTRGRVLIEHGNRYDGWNRIDYNGLRQERSRRSRHLPVDEAERAQRYFNPPAGTFLVIEVINRLKARYRFVDLLKPETGAVVPLMLALEPAIRPYLDALLRVGQGRLWTRVRSGKGRHDHGYMGSNAAASAAPGVDGVLADVLPPDEAALFAETNEGMGQVDNGPMGVRDALRDLHTATGIWLSGQIDRLVGTPASLAELARRDPSKVPDLQRRRLHAALKAVHARDSSFNPATEDEAYLGAARETIGSGDIDVVVYGHTHLPKSIRLAHAGKAGWYLNTGTWCDVMRLPEAIAADYEQAGKVLDSFLSALASNDFEAHLRRYLTFAEMEIDDATGSVDCPALHSFGGTADTRMACLTPFPSR